MLLGRIFELKKNEIKGEWRKVLKEKKLFSSRNIARLGIRNMRWGEHVASITMKKNIYIYIYIYI
jgi:hypothetical protein